MRARRFPVLALVAVLAVLAACGTIGEVSLDPTSDTTVAPQPTSGAITGATTSVARKPAPPSDVAAIAAAAVADVQAFWTTTLPQAYPGRTFSPLANGVIAAKPGVRLPACGGERVVYDDVRGNAFYCPDADFIAYDVGELFPELDDEFGPNVVAIVVAHEFGHAIQARTGTQARTIILELQADCFAGAWAAFTHRSSTSPFRFGPDDLNDAIGGFLEFRDEPGVAATDPEAHGNAFDRVGAFQDGFERGAAVCAGYLRTPPTITQIPFSSVADRASGGNLPYAEVLRLTLDDLDRFWRAQFVTEGRSYTPIKSTRAYRSSERITCGTATLANSFLTDNAFYCGADDYVAWDGVFLEGTVYAEIGDFAVSVLVSNAWADAMQTRLARTVAGKARSLQGHCYTGAWVGDVLRRGSNQLVLSPGDFDEGVIAFLVHGDVRKVGPDNTGTAFERVAAFRKGVQQTVGACGQ